MKESKFTGGVLEMIGYEILISLATALTFGLAFPFVVALYLRWEARNTFIEGRQLEFVGSGSELFAKYIIWLLLTFITFGIYGFWLRVKFLQWKTANTRLAGQNTIIVEG
ncbi:MAG: DUF898 family protein [Christensenellales bacterium]|jgi:uncharacterized membrane protein YjgN (DUF898 family)